MGRRIDVRNLRPATACRDAIERARATVRAILAVPTPAPAPAPIDRPRDAAPNRAARRRLDS